jgi:2',3'-cyclic-nucleotide 2'-phosphodiesterase (5'-nucleotidase family)
VEKTETKHSAVATPEVDSQLVKMILPYKTSLDAKMNEVIGYAPEALIKKQPESNLADFFADAIYWKASALPGNDTAHMIAIFNPGGLRTNVPQGDVHVGNMFELMPFENELVFFPLKGSKLMSVLNAIAEKGGAPVSGVRFSIEKNKAVGVQVHGIQLDTTAIYTIATSDYLANGGDRFFTVAAPTGVTKTGLLLRTILIDRCRQLQQQNKPVQSITDGRISVSR